MHPLEIVSNRRQPRAPAARGTHLLRLLVWLQWTSYPDIMAFQYSWTGYLKSVGSFFIGSSPEFELAVYTLCYKTRPNKL